MKEIATIPLFATPLTVYSIKHINQEKIENVLKSIQYNNIDKIPNHSSISKSLNVLNEHQDLNGLKVKIEQAIDNFSQKIVGNVETKFSLTTSWATETKTNEVSDIHKHSNNLFSAVYYNIADDQSSPIRFYKYNNETNMEISPEKYTIYNSNYWDIKPLDKLLLIFPSYLRHSIQRNKSKKTRYSIACNFHPIGNYGQGDSRLLGVNFKTIG
tara:strand:- start:762 stop:1400 length:639 start_codon:yes stop_codon:yes gene_type:complete